MSVTAASTTVSASATIRSARRSRSSQKSADTGTSTDGPNSTVGRTPNSTVGRTWTTVNGTCRIAASQAAHSAATKDVGEPSTATTMPWCLASEDPVVEVIWLSFDLRHGRAHFLPDRRLTSPIDFSLEPFGLTAYGQRALSTFSGTTDPFRASNTRRLRLSVRGIKCAMTFAFVASSAYTSATTFSISVRERVGYRVHKADTTLWSSSCTIGRANVVMRKVCALGHIAAMDQSPRTDDESPFMTEPSLRGSGAQETQRDVRATAAARRVRRCRQSGHDQTDSADSIEVYGQLALCTLRGVHHQF